MTSWPIWRKSLPAFGKNTKSASSKTSNGFELLKGNKIRYPNLLVSMFSMHDESLCAPRALRSGAAAYVIKHEPADRVLASIRRVLSGEIALSPSMEKKMMNQML